MGAILGTLELGAAPLASVPQAVATTIPILLTDLLPVTASGFELVDAPAVIPVSGDSFTKIESR